jgi:hypothetical protein
MNYSSRRSSAPEELGYLRIDGVEYDVSNLLVQSKKHDDTKRTPGYSSHRRRYDRSHSSRSLLKRSSCYIGYMERSQSFRRRKNTMAKSLMGMNQKKKEYGLKKAPPSLQYSTSCRNLKSPPPPPSPVREEEEIRRARRETYNHATTVEIAPGVEEILRGSVETKQAIQCGAITQVLCCCCTQTVKCIEDAAFFICPTCSVISQVPHGSWGVGLGFLL